MDTEDFADAIREDNRTALSRLGSSKALYALSEGEMEPAAVRSAAVTLAADAVATLEAWDGGVYADAAAATADHREAVADGAEPGDDSFAVTAVLADAGADADAAADADAGGGTDADADAEGTAERLGAFVGWTLVLEKVTEQCTGFFTGQADPTTAGEFREYAGTLDALRDDAFAELAAVDGEGAREAAEAAATDVIQAAYEEYVATLEEMGVNPKPVC